MKVVVIDDDADFRALIRNALEIEGYKVKEAENGIAGLKIIRDETPDLIICDVRMPLMDGDELLKTVRDSDGEMAITPFVFVSGTGGGKINRLKHGADNYFEKPVDLELLSAHVTSLLTGAKRVSSYIKSQLDLVAQTISESFGHEFDLFDSAISHSSSYVDTIVAALQKVSESGNTRSIYKDSMVSRLDYVDFFLSEHGKRKLLASTANGEDLSWLLIFLVAKSQIKNEKLPISNLYATAPSAKSTINARINSLVKEGVFNKTNDNGDGRRQLISLSERFNANLLSHIDKSLTLIRENVL